MRILDQKVWEITSMALVHPGSMTARQVEVLTMLSRQERWSVGEVASALGVSSAAATKAIIRLERKGLVTRSVDMMDRRCVNVHVTKSGVNAIRQVARGA
jgi:DNA-binding MarR family transcriptional regulator